MRWIALCLAWTAACTSSGPRPERAGGALPFGAPVIVHASPRAPADLGELKDLMPLDEQRALLTYSTHQKGGRELITMSLWSGMNGHVWRSSAFESRDVAPRVLPDAGVVIVPRSELVGAVGLDLDSGRERWRVTFATPSDKAWYVASRHLDDPAGPGPALHIHGQETRRTLVAYAPESGEVDASGAIPYDRKDGSYVLLTRSHVLYALPTDDHPPWRATDFGSRWAVLRRGDLAPIGHVDVRGGMCSIDERLYVVGPQGVVRVALDEPPLAPRLLFAPPTPLRNQIGCNRHGDDDVIWYGEHVLGVTPSGDLRWTIDLAGWHLDRTDGPANELPDRPVAFAWNPNALALLGLDLVQHRVEWIAPVLEEVEIATVLHDHRRSYVQLVSSAHADHDASVIAVVDGTRGEFSAAILVDGIGSRLRRDQLAGETLWIATSGPDPGEGWLRLAAATLRPLDAESPFTLHEALPWIAARLPRSIDSVVAAPSLP